MARNIDIDPITDKKEVFILAIDMTKAQDIESAARITFLSDEMTQLLKKSPSLVKALLRNSEKDAQTAISNIKTKMEMFIQDH
ncbi:hypothetical protein A9G13_01895 [Gilliamella sp. wkB178]|uniref:hypothetical protein n=1 Tax=Gilliamella sp. wkB178 TaxID=3120259 RepID=UPI00080DD3A8|nr:hypothetical protein [Gilliamella apicola]OCG08837.1 hypothetical protein A9G13_01895 [Gilliamella apicola]